MGGGGADGLPGGQTQAVERMGEGGGEGVARPGGVGNRSDVHGRGAPAAGVVGRKGQAAVSAEGEDGQRGAGAGAGAQRTQEAGQVLVREPLVAHDEGVGGEEVLIVGVVGAAYVL